MQTRGPEQQKSSEHQNNGNLHNKTRAAPIRHPACEGSNTGPHRANQSEKASRLAAVVIRRALQQKHKYRPESTERREEEASYGHDLTQLRQLGKQFPKRSHQ